MLLTLAFRHLLVRKRRAAFLLLGYGIGAGVMIVLLSVGEAMLRQSQDVSLVGGGEVTVLPQGIDIEALRTGSLGGLFLGIDRARYTTRELIGGRRHAAGVAMAVPVIEGKLIYLEAHGRQVAVRAGGEIPSRARAAGVGLRVNRGFWYDSEADSAYVQPTSQQLYDEIDHFHQPTVSDSTWGEWHYFNVVAGPKEWWYISYIVGGAIPSGRWGGQLLLTHHRPDGTRERFQSGAGPDASRFDTARADLTIGTNTVRQVQGVYSLKGKATGPTGVAEFELRLHPEANQFFPPLEVGGGDTPSGYVVPALRAEASGRVCVSGRCSNLVNAPAYHDHNWGVWRAVTWEWGMGRGTRSSLLYGGIYSGGSSASSTAIPFFLSLVDSLGVQQVMRFGRINYHLPDGFDLVARHDTDSLVLRVRVLDTQKTVSQTAGFGRVFLQMRGAFSLRGRLGAQEVSDSGMGFFETYVR